MKAKNSDVNWDAYYRQYVPVSDTRKRMRQWQAHSNFYTQWLVYINKIIPIYKKKINIFEIGSGIGGILTLLSRRGVNVTGSDVSKKAVSVGRILNPKTKYLHFNVETMKLPAARYDRIVAFEVLEHLSKLGTALAHIRDGLKKGGYFIGTTPYPYKKHVTAPTHINVLYPLEWKKLFLKNGFSEVRTYPMSLPPFLWRIHPVLNIIFPIYIPFQYWIATTLVIAKK